MVPVEADALRLMYPDALLVASPETCLLKLMNTSKAATSADELTKRTLAVETGGGRLLSCSTKGVSAPAVPVRTIDVSVAAVKVCTSVSKDAPGVVVASKLKLCVPVLVRW